MPGSVPVHDHHGHRIRRTVTPTPANNQLRTTHVANMARGFGTFYAAFRFFFLTHRFRSPSHRFTNIAAHSTVNKSLAFRHPFSLCRVPQVWVVEPIGKPPADLRNVTTSASQHRCSRWFATIGRPNRTLNTHPTQTSLNDSSSTSKRAEQFRSLEK